LKNGKYDKLFLIFALCYFCCHELDESNEFYVTKIDSYDYRKKCVVKLDKEDIKLFISEVKSSQRTSNIPAWGQGISHDYFIYSIRGRDTTLFIVGRNRIKMDTKHGCFYLINNKNFSEYLKKYDEEIYRTTK